MERKPRPLSQPVLSRSQWVRIAFVGILMAAGTLLLEAGYAPAGAPVPRRWRSSHSHSQRGHRLSCRSEAGSAFNRDILSDRRQLMLYGLALLLTFLPTELGLCSASWARPR